MPSWTDYLVPGVFLFAFALTYFAYLFQSLARRPRRRAGGLAGSATRPPRSGTGRPPADRTLPRSPIEHRPGG